MLNSFLSCSKIFRTMNVDHLIKRLKEIVEKNVFTTREKHEMVTPDGTELAWLFDFKRILLRSEDLDLVSEIFWRHFEKNHPFQVGGLESASIPVIAGIVMKSVQKEKPVNGFFVRKSRNKKGMLKMIEGELSDKKIILVDDFLNKGIRIKSIFSLDDFTSSLMVKNLGDKNKGLVLTSFKVMWYFKSEKPNYFYVLPKSAP